MSPVLDTSVQTTEPVLTWASDEVLKGSSDVVIVHKGERYHLKKTKNDRLILTK